MDSRADPRDLVDHEERDTICGPYSHDEPRRSSGEDDVGLRFFIESTRVGYSYTVHLLRCTQRQGIKPCLRSEASQVLLDMRALIPPLLAKI